LRLQIIDGGAWRAHHHREAARRTRVGWGGVVARRASDRRGAERVGGITKRLGVAARAIEGRARVTVVAHAWVRDGDCGRSGDAVGDTGLIGRASDGRWRY